MLMVLSLFRLFLPELSDLLMRLKVSVASLNFLEKRSLPNRYLSSSKHCLNDNCLDFVGYLLSSLISWKDYSRGLLSGAMIMSSSSSRFLEICDAIDSSKLIFDFYVFLDCAKDTYSLRLFEIGDLFDSLRSKRESIFSI